MPLSFTCDSAVFASAFATVARAVDTKNGRPGLNSVRVELSEGTLTLTGTNLERTICQSIELDGEGNTDGVALLPKATVESIVKTLDDDPITITERGGKLLVSSGSDKWTVTTSDPAEYPETILPPDEGGFLISGDDFAKMVDRTVFAVDAGKAASGAMVGVCIDISAGKIEATASDGKRLCHQEIEVNNEDLKATVQVIVPVDSLRLATSISKDEMVSIVIEGKSQLWFFIGRTKIGTRLMEGKYPQWKTLKENHAKTERQSFSINAKSFVRAISRAAIMKNESSNAIALDFSEGKCLLFGSQETGNSKIECSVDWDNETDVKMNISPSYLSEMIGSLGIDVIPSRVETSGGSWEIETEDGFWGVVMGMSETK